MSTKKLAKELGLLRQRSQSSNGTKKPLVSNQIFSYLIVIDFESTCWREKNTYSQEIIEFPAVLLNTSTGEVESEFHTYVQPQEHPILSEFCTELTGITQMQVEEGIPLRICLSRFTRWLQNLQLKMGVVFPNNQTSSAPSAPQKLCTFLTWSDWDLGVCLQYECKRKQLYKPDVLNSWIDLRSTYRMFYNKKPKGLNGALQDLGIQFEGREHSGLDDSRNTAQLAVRMMRDGCVMKITRSLGRTSIVKPMFGNTTADTKREKFNTVKEEKNPITIKTLSSSNPTSFQFKACLDTGKNLDTKESMCQSLVSPKTLLNVTTMPLGTKSLIAEVLTKTSPLVITDCPSPHSNNNINNLVLCSTIVSCLSNQIQLNQPAKTGVAEGLWEKEDSAENFSLETEDRCGSYDDVVLEGDDEVISKTERKSDIGYASDFDSGCSVWEEPDNTHSPGGHIPSRHNVTVSAEDNLIPQEVIKEFAMISTSTKMVRSSVNVCNNTSEIRQQSMIPISNPYFPVPKNVTQDLNFNLHNTGLKASLKTLEKSHSLHKFSKANTPLPFRNKPFIPKKTSTPNSCFARPKTVTTQHTGHKVAPKSSFKIYTAKSSCSSSSGSLCAPKNVLSSLSVNTLSTCTNTSTVSVSMKALQRITSPLCLCGRRSKRQLVSNGGPNHGRVFYCCPVHRSGSGGRMQKGCEFFKWESALIKNCSVASPATSVSLCHINSSRSSCQPQISTIGNF